MHKYAQLILILTILCSSLSCKQSELSAEEKAQVDELEIELKETDREISVAETERDSYQGGLIKVLIQTRIEILKTNKALLEQRISAIKSGSPVNIETRIYKPDIELMKNVQEDIAKQERELEEAKSEAAKYDGGLVYAMAQTRVVTIAQNLAMLEQQYLIAKYGLATPQKSEKNIAQDIETQRTKTITEPQSSTETKLEEKPPLENEIVKVTILDKKLIERDYQEFIFFKFDVVATGLDKKARAIKGVMNFNDLFGETMMMVNWTVDEPISPGGTISLEGGFKYNQFIENNRWVASTDKEDMNATYTVQSILYEDGTRKDF